ncbi:uncharacterized protein [Antennarius striatus]|uniref:uncharacterized protein n=1 Tax=Antennarius striatus TaxID=241820 RepID=UPI0035B338F9
MASKEQVIFCSMIVLIALFSTIIILVLVLALTMSSSEVRSLNTQTTAILGEDVLLSCFIHKNSDVGIYSVTWEKLGGGLVYQYKNGAPTLWDQSSQFKGRAWVNADGLTTGNASLLLREVKRSDEGVYACIIDTSNGKGEVHINMTTEEKGTCPEGWREFNVSCYFLSDGASSWERGRDDCRRRGADLVIIDSDEEQELLTIMTNGDAWIGLNDRSIEGTWEWIDGTLLTLSYWARGQPDNGGGKSQFGEEDCVHIERNARTKRNWNDRRCDHAMKWVCEMKA